jgi:4-amino-4-deoxy-L-arabinose transferase-like glycosyltransferase
MMETEGSAAQALAISEPAPAPVGEPVEIPPDRERWFQIASSPRFALPILIMVCSAAFFVNLGGYALYTKGEPREAVTVLDMFKGHSLSAVLLPMRAGVEIPSKPLLMHWLIAALSFLTGGVGEWTVRLPSAILATLGVVCCYLYVRRLFNQSAALLAALILATNFQYLQSAGGARVDMTLTFFMEIAFFEFLLIAEGLTSRRMPLYLALAAAVLAKGPVGVVLPAAAAAVWIALERRWSLLGQLDLVKGAVVVGILAGGWYLAAIMIGGRPFIDKQILSENVFTYLDKPGISRGHSHPFYFLELMLLAGFLPWSILLPWVGIRMASLQKLRNPRLLYLVIWVAVVLVFYSFAFSKRGVYLLALYPALAAATGLCLAEVLGAPNIPRWIGALSKCGGAFFALTGACGLLAALIVTLLPAVARRPFAAFGITAPAFVPNLAAAIGAQRLAVVLIVALLIALGYVLIRTGTGIAKFAVGTAVGIACLSIIANLYVLPAVADTIGLKDFSRQAARMIDGGQAAYYYGLNYDIAFYTDKTIPVIAHVSKDWPEFLILGQDTYQALASTEMRDYSPVLTSGATYLDGTGQMVLVRRKPA